MGSLRKRQTNISQERDVRNVLVDIEGLQMTLFKMHRKYMVRNMITQKQNTQIQNTKSQSFVRNMADFNSHRKATEWGPGVQHVQVSKD